MQTPNTPAARIIARFGANQLAAWTGRHRSRVLAWGWPTGKGGTGGMIPIRLRQGIIEGALAMGETVTASDFELQEGEAYLIGDLPDAEPAEAGAAE